MIYLNCFSFRASRKLSTTLLILTLIPSSTSLKAQETDDNPTSVLIVTAHPDDEGMFAATVYRITHDLGGTVDLALITDGAGGYHYSTLANDIYGKELTDPEIGRQYLPAIRKQELMAGGRIIGLRNYFFFDQPDLGKTEDQDSILTYVWDTDFVGERLDDVLKEGSYDFVFTHLPIKPFHSHHKAATILAIKAVERMNPADRPVILGSFTTGGLDDVVGAFVELEGHPETRIRKDAGPFVFDRSTPFGYNDRLNYNIVVNWLIAEHKSQGTMQLYMRNEGIERFWVFEMNDSSAVMRTDSLMNKVREAPRR
jgi:N-acetylglucosamine malate deacetylase 2